MAQVVHNVARVASNGSNPPRPVAGHQKDPRTLALALRDTGMPAMEIARRTGVSQDELAVALAAFAPPKAHPSVDHINKVLEPVASTEPAAASASAVTRKSTPKSNTNAKGCGSTRPCGTRSTNA